MVKLYADGISYFYPGAGMVGFGCSLPITHYDLLSESVAAYSHRIGKWIKYKWEPCEPAVLEELYCLRKA